MQNCAPVRATSLFHPAKGVRVKSPSRVRIPLSPPDNFPSAPVLGFLPLPVLADLLPEFQLRVAFSFERSVIGLVDAAPWKSATVSPQTCDTESPA